MKKTLVLGASTNPHRYSNMAAHKLAQHGHEIILVGKRPGEVLGLPILQEWPVHETFHTITLYLSPGNQQDYYDAILQSGAQRLIFNPGTENEELMARAKSAGIAVEQACTLVLLTLGAY